MIKTEDLGLPNLGPSFSFNVKNYAVRYMRADMKDAAQMAELETLETRGLEGKEIVIISKDHYSFMRDYFIVVNYLEKRSEEEKSART